MRIYHDSGNKVVANLTMFVTPAAHLKEIGEAEYPSKWVDFRGGEERPKTYEVNFVHGVAEVDDEMGGYMVRTGLALSKKPVKLILYG